MKIFNKDGKITLILPTHLSTSKKLEGKRFYKDRLMKVLGRTFWQVNGITKDWSENMLADCLHHCEPFSNIKLRNVKFKEYAYDTIMK